MVGIWERKVASEQEVEAQVGGRLVWNPWYGVPTLRLAGGDARLTLSLSLSKNNVAAITE